MLQNSWVERDLRGDRQAAAAEKKLIIVQFYIFTLCQKRQHKTADSFVIKNYTLFFADAEFHFLLAERHVDTQKKIKAERVHVHILVKLSA